jgi:hypothetical protein
MRFFVHAWGNELRACSGTAYAGPGAALAVVILVLGRLVPVEESLP